MEHKNQLKQVEAKNLININRLDIIAKYKYVENRLRKLDCDFFEKLYIKTIEAHTNGTFLSTEHIDKKGVKMFLKYFDNTIESVTKNGFNYDISKITLDKNGVVLDGGHRIAILIYMNEKVMIHNRENEVVNDNPKEFKKRLLEEKYIDYLVLEYYKLTRKASLLITTKQIDGKEKNDLSLIYEKEIRLTYTGMLNIKKITSQNNTVKRFGGKKKFYLYILENNEQNENVNTVINEKKSNILYYIQENIENIIYMLLNKNSINFLNSVDIEEFKKINLNLKDIKEQINESKFGLDDVIISIDKEKSDFEIIYMPLSEDKSENKKRISELIYNPENYIYIEDIKIIEKQQNYSEKKHKYKDTIKSIFHKIRILKRNLYFKMKLRIKEMVRKNK